MLRCPRCRLPTASPIARRAMSTMTTITVQRSTLAAARADKIPRPQVKPGEILLAVKSWSFTANNITYGLAGSTLRYWDFYPCADSERGAIPVWGTAEVVESQAADVQLGQRIYGFLPMAEFAVLQPGKVAAHGFGDASAHRADLPRVYNEYTRLEADPFYSAETEERMLLLRPLFFTSWLLDDFISKHSFFGASSVILTSASSKTAIGLAHVLRRQREGVTTIGLTSAGNLEMVRALGLYDRVITYDDLLGEGGGGLADEAGAAGAVLVDMAGSGRVITAVHHTLGDRLKHSCMVGLSHTEEAAAAQGKPPEGLPGPTPKFFFAPAWVKRRAAECQGGVGELLGMVLPAWTSFVADSERWLRLEHLGGEEQVLRGYAAAASGKSSPSVGTIMSLAPCP